MAVNIFSPPSFPNYMNLCVISGHYNFVFTFLFHSAIKFISSVNNNMCIAGHLVTQLIVTMNRVVTSKFLTFTWLKSEGLLNETQQNWSYKWTATHIHLKMKKFILRMIMTVAKMITLLTQTLHNGLIVTQPFVLVDHMNARGRSGLQQNKAPWPRLPMSCCPLKLHICLTEDMKSVLCPKCT